MVKLLVLPEDLSRRIHVLVSRWETEGQSVTGFYTHNGRTESQMSAN